MDIAAAVVAPRALLDALSWRYATKVFDPTRKISKTDWRTRDSGRLRPGVPICGRQVRRPEEGPLWSRPPHRSQVID